MPSEPPCDRPSHQTLPPGLAVCPALCGRRTPRCAGRCGPGGRGRERGGSGLSVDTNAARERLQAERARVVAEVQSLRDDLSHSIEDLADEDGNDSHLADSATETLDREMEQS